MPREKISAGLSYCWSSRISGAMYSLSPSRSRPGGTGRVVAMPKSPILRVPSKVMKTLAGLMSRWM